MTCIKKNQIKILELSNIVTKIKHLMHGLIRSCTGKRQRMRISELQVKSTENTQTEAGRIERYPKTFSPVVNPALTSVFLPNSVYVPPGYQTRNEHRRTWRYTGSVSPNHPHDTMVRKTTSGHSEETLRELKSDDEDADRSWCPLHQPQVETIRQWWDANGSTSISALKILTYNIS